MQLTNREWTYVQVLDKRLQDSEQRVAPAKSDLSFDIAEAGARKMGGGEGSGEMTEDKATTRCELRPRID
jgi:hypothetical protein